MRAMSFLQITVLRLPYGTRQIVSNMNYPSPKNSSIPPNPETLPASKKRFVLPSAKDAIIRHTYYTSRYKSKLSIFTVVVAYGRA